MKTRTFVLWACVCAVVLTGFAMAEDDPEPKPAVRRPAAAGRGPIAQPGERGRGPAVEPNLPANREEALREAMNRRMQGHRDEIAKLSEILKIAEEEQATKTAEAIKALIAEKDKEMKDQMQQAEKRRQEMQQRLQERLGKQGSGSPEGDTPAAPDQKRPEDTSGQRGRDRQKAK